MTAFLRLFDGFKYYLVYIDLISSPTLFPDDNFVCPLEYNPKSLESIHCFYKAEGGMSDIKYIHS